MFNVTDTALKHLADALDNIDDPKPENTCFRIVPAEGQGLTLSLGTPEPQDAEFERKGQTVLVLSQDVKERCDGRTLDSDETGNLVLM